MPHTTLCCLKGVEHCQQLMDEARSCGLTIVVPYPTITPNVFNIVNTRAETRVVYQFLEKYEKNPDVTILYDQKHHKCQRDVFRPRVIPVMEQHYLNKIKPRNVNSLPDNLLPALMRGYYKFPPITPEQRTIRPKIGVISLGGYYLLSDLQVYWNMNIANWNPAWGWADIVPLGPFDHLVGDNVLPIFERDIYSLENTLDIELVGGFCPSAEIHFYSAINTYQGYLEAFQDAITDQMDIVTTSWGQSEERFYGQPAVMQLFNQVFKTGTTGRDSDGNQISNHYTIFTAATGDYGSSDNDYKTYNISGYPVTIPLPHVDFPATSPWVVACGGTSLFLDPDVQIDDETAWVYGGGGQSSQFLRPSYQGAWQPQWPVSPLAKKDPGTGLPFARTIPDIVFNADPNSPWIIYFAGYVDEGSGTSASAPIMGGLLAEFYCASKPNTAPKNGYFGEGFNSVLYRSPSNTVKLIYFGYNVTVDRDPLTRAVNPYGIIDTPNNTYYKIWVHDLKYTFCTGKGVCLGSNLIVFLNTVVCVAMGTQILMADGVCKRIENIERGDQVIGYQGQVYRVADINRQLVPKNSTIDLIEILPHALGANQPSQRLIVTPNHPIFFQGARRPAKAFRTFPNVIEHTAVKPGTLLQPEMIDETGPVYFLYDLQFDDDGSYVAENLVVQSRSPWSNITPLPKELYFEPSRYKEETDWDGFNHQLPLAEEEGELRSP